MITTYLMYNSQDFHTACTDAIKQAGIMRPRILPNAPHIYPALVGVYVEYTTIQQGGMSVIKPTVEARYYPKAEIKRIYYAIKLKKAIKFRNPNSSIVRNGDDIVRVSNNISAFFNALPDRDRNDETKSMVGLVANKFVRGCAADYLPAYVTVAYRKCLCHDPATGNSIVVSLPDVFFLPYLYMSNYMSARKNKKKGIDKKSQDTFENHISSLFGISGDNVFHKREKKIKQ